MFSCHSPWLQKIPQSPWHIWKSISPWNFFHELKGLRSVLGSVCLERFKSSMILCIFYQVNIFRVALDFFFFIPKMSKCIDSFRLGLIFSIFRLILCIAPWFVQCFAHFIYQKFTFLHSRFTSLQVLVFVFCIRKVRYISPTLLPDSALNFWRKRNSSYPQTQCV